MLIIDASVAYKWVVREPDSGLARGLIGSDTLGGPALILVEVANALWSGVRRGNVAAAHASQGVDDLPPLLDRLFPVEPLVAPAFSVARDLDHPVYDCVYLALSGREGATLVTADGRLLRRVKGTPWATHVRDLASFGPTP